MRKFDSRTNLVDQVAGSGRLARIDVSDDNDVNMSLFLSVSGIDVSGLFKTMTARNVKQKAVITASHQSSQPVLMSFIADDDAWCLAVKSLRNQKKKRNRKHTPYCLICCDKGGFSEDELLRRT